MASPGCFNPAAAVRSLRGGSLTPREVMQVTHLLQTPLLTNRGHSHQTAVPVFSVFCVSHFYIYRFYSSLCEVSFGTCPAILTSVSCVWFSGISDHLLTVFAFGVFVLITRSYSFDLAGTRLWVWLLISVVEIFVTVRHGHWEMNVI